MKNFNYNFKNKVIIVTGASRGLGYEIAKSYLINGANLIICSRNFNKIKKSYKKLLNFKKKKSKNFLFIYKCFVTFRCR